MHSLSLVFRDRKVVLLDPYGVLRFGLYLVPSFSVYPLFLWLVNFKSVVYVFLVL